VLVIILIFGIVPSAYVQVATRYVKAGMISIVSMTVVALGKSSHRRNVARVADLQTFSSRSAQATISNAGAAYENFYKRLVAFIVGGSVALLIELFLYPVRARECLVEAVSSCIKQIINMQAAVAVGIDDPIHLKVRNPQLHKRFSRARDKAQSALSAAETFLPFCLSEPRLKGNFKRLAPIYREITYVLHHIIDRMDNLLQLRKEYGNSVLEDLNSLVYAYRRNVEGSITVSLFAVDEALTTRLPLPQFLPSSRHAQLMLVHRVRQIMLSKNASGVAAHETSADMGVAAPGDLDEQTAKVLTQHRFLSWNASAAGQMEIIEYLEELIDLVKLLVGVNAFKTGMFQQPNYRQHVWRLKSREASHGQNDDSAAGAVTGTVAAETNTRTGRPRRNTIVGALFRSSEETYDLGEEEQIPMSLQRVQNRVREERSAAARRRASMATDTKGKGFDR
jgi:hypothetical protein